EKPEESRLADRHEPAFGSFVSEIDSNRGFFDLRLTAGMEVQLDDDIGALADRQRQTVRHERRRIAHGPPTEWTGWSHSRRRAESKRCKSAEARLAILTVEILNCAAANIREDRVMHHAPGAGAKLHRAHPLVFGESGGDHEIAINVRAVCGDFVTS